MERKRNETVLGILRLVAGVYLIYLSKVMLTDYFKEHTGIIFLIGSIFFIGTAIFFIIDGIIMLKRDLKARYDAFYAKPEEENVIVDDAPQTEANAVSEAIAEEDAEPSVKLSSPWAYNNAADEDE